MTKTVTAAEEREFARARQNAERDRRAGLCGASAIYDRKSRRILVELTNGNLFGFPVTKVPGLEHATDAQIGRVTMGPGGYSVLWEELEADDQMPGVLLSAVGLPDHVKEIGRLGGMKKSRAKASAARRNGAKGGRPRKTARTSA